MFLVEKADRRHFSIMLSSSFNYYCTEEKVYNRFSISLISSLSVWYVWNDCGLAQLILVLFVLMTLHSPWETTIQRKGANDMTSGIKMWHVRFAVSTRTFNMKSSSAIIVINLITSGDRLSISQVLLFTTLTSNTSKSVSALSKTKTFHFHFPDRVSSLWPSWFTLSLVALLQGLKVSKVKGWSKYTS